MTQGEIEKLGQKTEQIFSDLGLRIMSDIVRRIKINGFSTASADWQFTRIQQLGKSEEDIKKWIQEALESSDEEIERIFSEETYKQYMTHERAYEIYGLEQIPFEENVQLQHLIEATKKQISLEFKNMANSMGFAIKGADGNVIYSPLLNFYRSTLDNAVIDIQSGSFSYQRVLERTIRKMTASGVRWVDYESGWHNRVDVAARRAVLTGFRQTQGYINERVAKDLGTDYYEVTYHVGARPTHQPWQGRVYNYKDLESVCGLGTVTGLHGANCYHDYYPFIPGVSIRTYTDEQLDRMIAEENTLKEYNGKQYTTYEALQQQRKMETSMRRTRQDIKLLQDGDADSASITLKKAKYYGQMQTYEAFSKKMGLPLQKQRIYQDGLKGTFSDKRAYDKLHAATASKVANKSGGSSDLEWYLNKLKGKQHVQSSVSWKEYIQDANEKMLNEAHTKLNKTMIEEHVEIISIIEKGNSEIYYQKGNQIDSVELSKETLSILKKAKSNSITFSHVHPGQTPFSQDDIRKIIDFESISELSLECADGTKYILERGNYKSKFLDKLRFDNKYTEVYNEVAKGFPELEDSEKVYEVWDEFIREVNIAVSEKYGFVFKEIK